jgi:hypothetical protein
MYTVCFEVLLQACDRGDVLLANFISIRVYRNSGALTHHRFVEWRDIRIEDLPATRAFGLTANVGTEGATKNFPFWEPCSDYLETYIDRLE